MPLRQLGYWNNKALKPTYEGQTVSDICFILITIFLKPLFQLEADVYIIAIKAS